MTRVLRDLHGVTHAFEAAAWHNTRCGRRAETRTTNVGVPWTPVGGRDGDALPDGTVDCMACLAGRSHLGMEDLRDGVEVQAWVRLYGEGGFVGSAQPITFTRGTNVDRVIFDDVPVGAVARGYSYLDEDGRELNHHVAAFPGGVARRHEDDTIEVEAGGAQVR